MDSKEHLASSCDTLSTTAPEAPWNLQICIPTLKIDIKEETTAELIYEKESPCSDYMYPSKHLQLSECVNYYDSKRCDFKQPKEEFPYNVCLQSDNSMISKIVPVNKESIKQEIKHENTEEELLLHIKEETDYEKYQVIVKTEVTAEEDILDNPKAISIHYDVLLTPEEVKCKLCGRIFKNSFNLLRHNIEHIKVEINTPGDNSKVIELHQCQYCSKSFENYNNMLTHVADVHSENKHKCEICGELFNSAPNLERHVKLFHENKNSPNLASPNDMKCIYCNVEFKHKYRLTNHIKQCRPAKKDKDIKHKCNSCERVYKSKRALLSHIKKTHYEYGRMFECWCGKQFRSPIHLSGHKTMQHKSKKNLEYKCECCEAVFKVKRHLARHMIRMHHDYGRSFECWCGKQFRTPIHLSQHKRRRHNREIKTTNNVKFQCDTCQKYFKNKQYLAVHIKRVHYDYGRTFECSCGKQFRSPIHLSGHKTMQHKDRKNSCGRGTPNRNEVTNKKLNII